MGQSWIPLSGPPVELLKATCGPALVVSELAREIARRHKIALRSLLSVDRSRRYAWPRQEWYARAKKATGLGRVALGKLMGRDRQTIWHGIRAYEKRIASITNAGG